MSGSLLRVKGVAMKSLLRRTTTISLAVCVFSALALGQAVAAAPSQAPLPPTSVELLAGSDFSITISWIASPGATRYNIYRGTSPGGEGNTPIATTTSTTYKDSHLRSTPVYFYQLTAVNSFGQSARTPEDASKTPPPPSTGGNLPGVRQGNSLVFYGKDARLAGFDWFEALQGWFPEALFSAGSISPGQSVIDMAYSSRGTMTFNNVQVKTAGLYTIDWRYAFASGLFPGVTNRQMGLKVNGRVITTTENFPITGNFDSYKHSYLQVNLRAGVNSISLFAVSDHGVARVDQMTVTPSGPGVKGALFQGSTGNVTLRKPIVGMAVDPATGGYWLVASDGGVFSFNASFEGSTGNIALHKPIVGMAVDRSTGGYWLVSSDGGVFSFNAPFHGSIGKVTLSKPIVGMAVDQSTGGYWLVAFDGGVFSFDVPFDGSTGNIALRSRVVGMASSSDSSGYYLVAGDGGIFTFQRSVHL
jgi:hypothetical protein